MRLGLSAALFVCLALLGCSGTPTTVASVPAGPVDPAAVESLARDFEQVAFTDVRFGRDIAVARLKAPIYVEVDARGLPHPSWADSVVSLIASGSGLDLRSGRSDVVEMVVGGNYANGFYVDVVSDRRLTGIDAELHASGVDRSVSAEALLRRDDWPCFVTGFSDKSGREIDFVTVRHSAPSEQRTRCLSREILGFMGLHGALATPGSIFSQQGRAVQPTERDLTMVRMLYDPRLKPGMSATQARPLLPAIAADALAR